MSARHHSSRSGLPREVIAGPLKRRRSHRLAIGVARTALFVSRTVLLAFLVLLITGWLP